VPKRYILLATSVVILIYFQAVEVHAMNLILYFITLWQKL